MLNFREIGLSHDPPFIRNFRSGFKPRDTSFQGSEIDRPPDKDSQQRSKPGKEQQRMSGSAGNSIAQRVERGPSPKTCQQIFCCAHIVLTSSSTPIHWMRSFCRTDVRRLTISSFSLRHQCLPNSRCTISSASLLTSSAMVKLPQIRFNTGGRFFMDPIFLLLPQDETVIQSRL